MSYIQEYKEIISAIGVLATASMCYFSYKNIRIILKELNYKNKVIATKKFILYSVA